MDEKGLIKYEKHYSEPKLWTKISKFARKAGIKTVYYALLLFYALSDPAVPKKYRMVIIGALGYFICPVDLLPDFFPGGIADDYGVLAAAVLYVISHITPEIKEKAQKKLSGWFPSWTADELGDMA